MSSLYERYRDLLRDGHVAARDGRHEVALVAYREAATLIAERAAPWVGVGTMELALGHPAEAAAAYRTAAELDPADATAADGLARALAALDATTGDAGTADEPGAPPEVDEPGAAAEPAVATGPPPVIEHDDGPEIAALLARWDAAAAALDVDALIDVAVAFANAGRSGAAVTVAFDALSLAPGAPQVHETLAWLARQRGAVGEAATTDRLLRVFLDAEDDPEALERRTIAAEADLDIGELLAIAEEHRRHERPRLALEAAFTALRGSPGDPAVHLAIVRGQLELGLREPATTELALLARLAEIDGDATTLAHVATVVSVELHGR